MMKQGGHKNGEGIGRKGDEGRKTEGGSVLRKGKTEEGGGAQNA